MAFVLFGVKKGHKWVFSQRYKTMEFVQCVHIATERWLFEACSKCTLYSRDLECAHGLTI